MSKFRLAPVPLDLPAVVDPKILERKPPFAILKWGAATGTGQLSVVFGRRFLAHGLVTRSARRAFEPGPNHNAGKTD